MRLIENNCLKPRSSEFYNAQTPEVKARIDAKLQDVQPYYNDEAFVGEVLREMNLINRQILTSPKTGMAMVAG